MPGHSVKLWQKRQISAMGYFTPFSSDTVSLYLPLALLLASTRLPFLVAMRDLKPCLFTLFLLEG